MVGRIVVVVGTREGGEVCVATREGGEVCVATREEGQSVVRVATHEVLRQPVIQRGCSWTELPARLGSVFCRCKDPRGWGGMLCVGLPVRAEATRDTVGEYSWTELPVRVGWCFVGAGTHEVLR